VRGVSVGDHKVLRGESTVVPRAIAAFLFYLRDENRQDPQLLLGLDGGQPVCVRDPLHPLRGG
jgi:hypothetical protein